MAAIQLDDANIKAIISEAILSSLDGAKREAIFKAALEHVLAPRATYTGGPVVSPIEEAFRNAIVQVAHDTAVEMVTKDPVIAGKIKAVMVSAAERVFATPEKMIEKVENAIRAAITGDRY